MGLAETQTPLQRRNISHESMANDYYPGVLKANKVEVMAVGGGRKRGMKCVCREGGSLGRSPR